MVTVVSSACSYYQVAYGGGDGGGGEMCLSWELKSKQASLKLGEEPGMGIASYSLSPLHAS